MATRLGWLFGLESESRDTLSGKTFTLRPMSEQERARVRSASQDFFAKDFAFWQRMMSRFPYVYERVVEENQSIGSIDTVAIVCSLLSMGEVRSPVQWSQGGGSSSSEVIDYFLRFINGKFQSVKFEDIRAAATVAIDKLQDLSPPVFYGDNFFLIDRLYSSKKHIILADGDTFEILARAADICIGLEYLFNEGQTSEVQFRLSTSLAWTLESDPTRREAVIEHVQNTYKLRSKRVHGAKLSAKGLKDTELESLAITDRLFRRAILTRVISALDHEKWIQMVRRIRLGHEYSDLDRIQWLAI